MKGYFIHKKPFVVIVSLFFIMLILIIIFLNLSVEYWLYILACFITFVPIIFSIFIIIINKEKYLSKIYIFEDRFELKYKRKIIQKIYFNNIKHAFCYLASDRFTYFELAYLDELELKKITLDFSKKIEKLLFGKGITIEYNL